MRLGRLLRRTIAFLALRAVALALIGWGALYWATGDPNSYKTRHDQILRAQDAFARAGHALGR